MQGRTEAHSVFCRGLLTLQLMLQEQGQTLLQHSRMLTGLSAGSRTGL